MSETMDQCRRPSRPECAYCPEAVQWHEMAFNEVGLPCHTDCWQDAKRLQAEPDWASIDGWNNR